MKKNLLYKLLGIFLVLMIPINAFAVLPPTIVWVTETNRVFYKKGAEPIFEIFFYNKFQDRQDLSITAITADSVEDKLYFAYKYAGLSNFGTYSFETGEVEIKLMKSLGFTGSIPHIQYVSGEIFYSLTGMGGTKISAYDLATDLTRDLKEDVAIKEFAYDPLNNLLYYGFNDGFGNKLVVEDGSTNKTILASFQNDDPQVSTRTTNTPGVAYFGVELETAPGFFYESVYNEGSSSWEQGHIISASSMATKDFLMDDNGVNGYAIFEEGNTIYYINRASSQTEPLLGPQELENESVKRLAFIRTQGGGGGGTDGGSSGGDTSGGDDSGTSGSDGGDSSGDDGGSPDSGGGSDDGGSGDSGGGDDGSELCTDLTDKDGDGSPECSCIGTREACVADECDNPNANDAETKVENPCGCNKDPEYKNPENQLSCSEPDECPDVPYRRFKGLCECTEPYVETLEEGQTLEEACTDLCPYDGNKATPGICGCGKVDTNLNANGSVNCEDECLNDPSKTEPGICGCGKSDDDTDGDGVPDCNDNCPLTAFKTETDECGCNLKKFYKKDGSVECRSFTSLPTNSKDKKVLINPKTGEALVPERPMFEVPETCEKKCKVSLVLEKYLFSTNANDVEAVVAAGKRKNKRSRKNSLKAKYAVTLNKVDSRGSKTSKRYTKKKRVSFGNLKPGTNYIVSYKVQGVKQTKNGRDRVVATSSSSKSISFQTPG